MEYRKREVTVYTVNAEAPANLNTEAGHFSGKVALSGTVVTLHHPGNNVSNHSITSFEDEELAKAVALIAARGIRGSTITISKETKTIEEARVY